MTKRKNVLGSLGEIDHRCKVGSAAWQKRHPSKVQKLSALRRSHLLASHPEVKVEIVTAGAQKAHQLRPKRWVKIVRNLESK